MAEYSARLVANPPIPPALREAYERRSTETGKTLLEIWRQEFRKTLQDIAKEPAWSLQKRLLLWHLVKEAGWIALYNTVKPNDRIECWRGFVEDIDMFKPLKPEHFYGMLAERFLFAILTNAVLWVIGVAAFGLNEQNQRSIEMYEAQRKDYILTVIGLWRGYFKVEREFDGEFASHYANRAAKLEPVVQEMIAYSGLLSERVVNETMDFSVLQNELDRFEKRKLAALEELKASQS